MNELPVLRIWYIFGKEDFLVEILTPEDKRKIENIFLSIEDLILQTEDDKSRELILPGIYPTGQEVSGKEIGEAHFLTIKAVWIQLVQYVDELEKINPISFDQELGNFLREFPEKHPEKELVYFWTLKFFIEAHIEGMICGFNQD